MHDMSKFRIFIVNDEPLLRFALKQLVASEDDLEICGESERCKGTVNAILSCKPDIILLELSYRDGCGLKLIRRLRFRKVTSPVLVFSIRDEGVHAERALRAGANGYISKYEDCHKIVAGIRRVIRGELCVSEEVMRNLVTGVVGITSLAGKSTQLCRLSDREIQVLTLIGHGEPPRSIGAALGITAKTVDAHRTNIKKKLGLADAAKLLRYAIRFVDDEPMTSAANQMPLSRSFAGKGVHLPADNHSELLTQPSTST